MEEKEWGRLDDIGRSGCLWLVVLQPFQVEKLKLAVMMRNISGPLNIANKMKERSRFCSFQGD